MLYPLERVSRYWILITMPEAYGSATALAGLVEALEQVPPHLRKSLTFEVTYDLRVWFCEPHRPWQRGELENQNQQWRW